MTDNSMKNSELVLPGILILTHGPLAVGLLESAKLIMGEQERIKALPLEEGSSVEEYGHEIVRLLDELGPEPIVLLDIFGGTPFNQLVSKAAEKDFYAICGVNLPMLIETVSLRLSLSGEELYKEVMNAGKEGVVSVNEFIAKVF